MNLKHKLAELFRQPRKNRAGIRLALYELAGKICPADEDLRQQVWIHLDRTIEKFDSTRGDANAFGYFSQCGQRRKWELAEGRKHHEELTESTVGIQPRDIETSQPVPESDPVKLLKKIMRKLKGEIAHLEAGTSEYQFAAAGVHWLQCFAHELIGQYLPMTLPTVKYSRDRVTPTPI